MGESNNIPTFNKQMRLAQAPGVMGQHTLSEDHHMAWVVRISVCMC